MDDLTRIEERIDRLEALVEGILHGLIGKEKRDEWLKWWESDEQVLRRAADRKWSRAPDLHAQAGHPREADRCAPQRDLGGRPLLRGGDARRPDAP
jgi:hypothetical protein